MTGPDPHPCELLGAYVLGLCDPPEAASVEAHLLACEGCCEETAGLARVVALLSHRRPRRRRVAVALAAAAVVAVAALAGLLALLSGTVAPRAARVALRPAGPAPAASGSALLSSRAWGTEIVLRVRGLPPTATTYTAEVLTTDGTRLAVGSWGPTPDHSAVVELAAPVPTTHIARLIVVRSGGPAILEGGPAPPSGS